MPPDAVSAQVVKRHRDDAALDRPADHRGAERRVEELRKEGDDVDPEQRRGSLTHRSDLLRLVSDDHAPGLEVDRAHHLAQRGNQQLA